MSDVSPGSGWWLASDGNWYPPEAATVCEVCGRGPAERLTMHRNVGMVFRRRSYTRDSVLCRQCGVAIFRSMTNRTIIQGWWGFISLFVNVGYLINNLQARWSLRAVGKPVGIPSQPPVDPGRPMILRSGVWLATGVLALGIWQNVYDPNVTVTDPASAMDHCLRFGSDKRITSFVKCSAGHGGRVVGVYPGANPPCPSGTTGTVLWKSESLRIDESQ